MFTDVEGSTRRWENDAAAMRAALAAHDEVLRNAIQAHGGFMFKHTGDGVCAAFSSPRSAIDAAVADGVATAVLGIVGGWVGGTLGSLVFAPHQFTLTPRSSTPSGVHWSAR